MTLRFHWFLPTSGDGRDIVGGGHGTSIGSAGTMRPASIEYLGQIARSAEQLGFVGALTPTGAWCEDAWLTTAMLVEGTERLKFLVAFRPGLISPTLSAQMAATFQRHSKGRLLLNVVTGGESGEQRAYGDFEDKAHRYARASEFLEIVSRLVLSGYPHLEEAYWFGEGVFPVLAARGLWSHPAPESLEPAATTAPIAPTTRPIDGATAGTPTAVGREGDHDAAAATRLRLLTSTPPS
jgi:hypothetical protein